MIAVAERIAAALEARNAADPLAALGMALEVPTMAQDATNGQTLCHLPNGDTIIATAEENPRGYFLMIETASGERLPVRF